MSPHFLFTRRPGCKPALILLTLMGSTLLSCGYKTPPSPVFDEGERFKDQIDERRKRDERGVQSGPSATDRIFWTLPAPTASPQPKGSAETKKR